jgi:hypothetical protein
MSTSIDDFKRFPDHGPKFERELGSAYHPVKTRPWSQILDHYAPVETASESKWAMQDLVEKIASTHYAAGLYACTSMWTLILSQRPEFEWNRETLRIEYSSRSDEFEFTFYEHPNTKPWVTHCSGADGFRRFERCMTVKGWFAPIGAEFSAVAARDEEA